ncbi:hypothetical protein AAMO2058_001304600 [Amorphochlora amoebiformis]
MKANNLLHSVFLVSDIEKTIEFCTQVLGMKVLRSRDLPAQKATSSFLGYGPEGQYFTIQLLNKKEGGVVDLGDAFSGFSLTLPHKTLTEVVHIDKAKAYGGKVADPMKNWILGPNMIPDEDVDFRKTIQRGYVYGPSQLLFEVNNGTVRDPLSRVRLRVVDLEKSIEFYEKLGMKIHQKRAHLLDEPYDTRLTAIMGFGNTEEDSGCVELIYFYNTQEIDIGDKHRQISVSTQNVTAAAEVMEDAGYSLIKRPSKLDGVGTEVAAVKDPDGYMVVLVNEGDFKAEIDPKTAEDRESSAQKTPKDPESSAQKKPKNPESSAPKTPKDPESSAPKTPKDPESSAPKTPKDPESSAPKTPKDPESSAPKAAKAPKSSAPKAAKDPESSAPKAIKDPESSTPKAAKAPKSRARKAAKAPKSSAPKAAKDPESSAPKAAKDPKSSAPKAAKPPKSSAPKAAKPPKSSAPKAAKDPESSAPKTAKDPESSAPKTAKDPESSAQKPAKDPESSDSS